jgi:glycosyltransferase involved in cell wall biosynthesis
VDAKKPLNPSALFSPHGVDASLFGQASNPTLEVAQGAKDLRHPVIGFFGVIGAWIDVELIAHLAQARPDWTFLLIGMASVDVGGLQRLSNVVLAGPQPYESLPRWAKAFDVAIIPYIPTQRVLSANLLKLREYLATGKPVVSVSTPEVDRFAHCVRIADTREAFLREIEEALAHDCEADRIARMQAIAGMTWEARVKEVIAVIDRWLQESGREDRN